MSEPLTDEELDDLKAFASRPYLGNMLMIDHITVLRLVEEVRRLRLLCDSYHAMQQINALSKFNQPQPDITVDGT